MTIAITKKVLLAHILEGFDCSGYDIIDTPENDNDKIQIIKEVFYSEYGFNVFRMGLNNSIKEWLQGLPSIVNIHFYNHDILKFCFDNGKAFDLNDEKLCDKILSMWFGKLAETLLREFNKLDKLDK